MKIGFERWWQEEGRTLDPDTEDIPWFDKREGLAAQAFEAGIRCGMTRAGNYTASDSVTPDAVTFANGRTVRIVQKSSPDCGPYLEIGRMEALKRGRK